MQCPRCQQPCQPDSKYCPHDGSLLVRDAADGPADALIGAVLERRYRIDSQIGAGGFGTVYSARQLKFDREVAIKVLSPEAASSPEHVRRFENEARVVGHLRHPATLTLLDFGQTDDGRVYAVTERLHGEPLSDILARGRLETSRVFPLLRQVCDSLVEAHEKGIVHRDIKPSNLFVQRVGDQEIVKVLDFGIAKLLKQPGLTVTGQTCGTPAYMSPEQARGETVDARSDLYSLGVLAYECLAGQPPFDAATPVSLLIKHIQDEPVPLCELEPPVAVTPQVDAFVLHLLEKLPDDRPADAAEVGRAIDALLRTVEASDPEPLVPLATMPVSPRRDSTTDLVRIAGGARWPKWALAAGLLAGLGVVIGVGGSWAPQDKREDPIRTITYPAASSPALAAHLDTGRPPDAAVSDAAGSDVDAPTVSPRRPTRAPSARPRPRPPRDKLAPRWSRTASTRRKPNQATPPANEAVAPIEAPEPPPPAATQRTPAQVATTFNRFGILVPAPDGGVSADKPTSGDGATSQSDASSPSTSAPDDAK